MSKTRATAVLSAKGVEFALHRYDYDPSVASIGLAAAQALGVDPAEMFKTLMVLADGKPALAILPANCELSMKKAAAALGAKSATMMPVPQAERLSGYKVGGISPFGQTRPLPALIDQSALSQSAIFLNGGQRGLQLRLNPQAVVAVLGAVVAPIAAG